MRSAIPPLLLSVFLLGQAHAAPRFDRAWTVTLETPDYTDPTGMLVKGYSWVFPAQVKEGVFHGEHGTKGAPAWLAIDGKIGPDGTANLQAKGISNLPEHAIMHVKTGTPYAYQIKAHFTDNRGTGKRFGGRVGNFTFVKG
jgi:hypothetical protein